MPKMTLLEVVAHVADKISSDEVTTLATDSVEVQEIKDLCLEVLEDIIYRNEWEFLRDRLMQMTAGTNEIELTIPTNVKKIQTVKYRHEDAGIQSGYRTLQYMLPHEFIQRLQNNRPTEPNTATVTINGVELYPRTNRQPRYWTSFNETTIVLDSYDAEQNPTGVDATDSTILATIYLDFTGSDVETWVAPIPEQMFTLWKQEAVAEATVQMRQSENPRAERRARRTYTQQIKKEPVTHKDEGSEEVNYGR